MLQPVTYTGKEMKSIEPDRTQSDIQTNPLGSIQLLHQFFYYRKVDSHET